MSSNNKLYVGNLSPSVEENVLSELINERSGCFPASILVKGAGYAFVECPDPEMAEKIKTSLNGFPFMGSQLIVQDSLPRPRSDPSFSRLNCIWMQEWFEEFTRPEREGCLLFNGEAGPAI
ncbi:Insulin-like growth factor 2 mRNA-binding [Argiope bruennichi]|uniref:Insulin-like growth factor 2 mRNA-binding n=1 Tax=Argiope bruennichi TaxID=94029 RepID=A0A8T0G0C4_ARGBR|nr:Insulin-like growth factor 2 mRNA-binding [Argiope bruennichi]